MINHLLQRVIFIVFKIKIFFQCIKWMATQKAFQSQFKTCTIILIAYLDISNFVFLLVLVTRFEIIIDDVFIYSFLCWHNIVMYLVAVCVPELDHEIILQFLVSKYVLESITKYNIYVCINYEVILEISDCFTSFKSVNIWPDFFSLVKQNCNIIYTWL
jgi:hypothetical protein